MRNWNENMNDRPKLPPDDPYSEEAEMRRAQHLADLMDGKAQSPVKAAKRK